jgi:EAL domain-containing protein (putative c-di-GMP-specific phosphodiesterase class I)
MSVAKILRDLADWFGPADTELRNIKSDGSSTPNKTAEPTCFIIEDEPGVRHFLLHVLRSRGVKVHEFSGASGIARSVIQECPQLIFLDLALEGSDAVEAIRELATARYEGAVQLISGRGGLLLKDIQLIGSRHRLNMLPVLEKPLRLNAVSELVDRCFAPFRASSAASVAPKISLADALQRNLVEVWYQPKIDLKRMRVVGMEALARVNHPEHGILLPGSFLPDAHEDSLIRLTEHVLVTVLHDWPDFHKIGGALVPAMNVPVSAMFKARIAALLRQHAPQDTSWPGMIMELTESQIIGDVALAKEISTQLAIYDVKLSIDDFGEGYSSFSRLKEVPFSELKIDRKFVENCATNSTNKAICESVVTLAHRLGCIAVAEGVEREADLRVLHELGCDLVQGFLLARPMPKRRLEAILKQRQEKQARTTSSPLKVA